MKISLEEFEKKVEEWFGSHAVTKDRHKSKWFTIKIISDYEDKEVEIIPHIDTVPSLSGVNLKVFGLRFGESYTELLEKLYGLNLGGRACNSSLVK